MMHLTFDEATHEYKYEGVVVPSVTQILQLFGLYSFYGSSQWHMDRGTNLHTTMALLDENNLGEYDPDFEPQINEYKAFKERYNPQWTLIETQLFSKAFKFAGTPDRIGYIDGKLSIVDLKFGAHTPAYDLQTAGYQVLAEEVLGLKIQKRYSLSIKDKYSFKEHTHKSDRSVFLGLITAYWWAINNKVCLERNR